MHRHTHTHAGDTYPFTLTRKKEHNNFIGAKAISSGTMALIHQKEIGLTHSFLDTDTE